MLFEFIIRIVVCEFCLFSFCSDSTNLRKILSGMVTPFLSGVFNYNNNNIYFVALENFVKEYAKNIFLSINTRWRKKYYRYCKRKSVLFFYQIFSFSYLFKQFSANVT